MSSNIHSGELETRAIDVGGVQLNLTSYAVGRRFSCRIETADGGNLSRASGATREEAEQSALEQAALTLELRDARVALTKATDAMKRGTPATGVDRRPARREVRRTGRPTTRDDDDKDRGRSG